MCSSLSVETVGRVVSSLIVAVGMLMYISGVFVEV